MDKVKLRKNYHKIIIIFSILAIILHQTNFFKKLYFTLTRSYEARLIKKYEFCGSESIGFLDSIKKKFSVDYEIPIVNYAISPNSSWYYNGLKKIKTNKVIFLNYPGDIKNFDHKKNNKFSHDLRLYKIIYQHNNCYFLEIND